MFKAVDFPSSERTQHVFGCISIVWFTSVFVIAGSQSVALEATSEVLASCGDNVTMTCNATSTHKLDIKLFAWYHNMQDLCQPDPDTVLCESSAETSHHRLTLTLINVMPVNEGKYLCKLQSVQGVTSTTTVLTVQNCLESSDSFVNHSHAECRFSGVYPYSTVHWFQGDDNLTGHATTQEEKDQHGRYNVSSKIMVEQGKLSQAYNCSLWIHDDSKYVSEQVLEVQKISSAGCLVRLQCIFMLVEIMMLKFMT